ncbi:hypothetical protein GUJ93_ZPchr0002g24499 [Zizania palustris]|uniref:Uncharacterized protein n=1 Tax=Zizania palustris TaxID=103762 RepID=A0A8J5RUK3_ZIZPA|nr:hypothetical protein GUJ93_ZPchr0002g24499 [Zizania palustris]
MAHVIIEEGIGLPSVDIAEILDLYFTHNSSLSWKLVGHVVTVTGRSSATAFTTASKDNFRILISNHDVPEI